MTVADAGGAKLLREPVEMATLDFVKVHQADAGANLESNALSPAADVVQRMRFTVVLGMARRVNAKSIKVYQKVPYECESVTATTGTCAGRAGFLAGFAYYELSRQSQANTERVPQYVIMLLGTFTLCMVVVVRDAVVQRAFRQVLPQAWFLASAAGVVHRVRACPPIPS